MAVSNSFISSDLPSPGKEKIMELTFAFFCYILLCENDDKFLQAQRELKL